MKSLSLVVGAVVFAMAASQVTAQGVTGSSNTSGSSGHSGSSGSAGTSGSSGGGSPGTSGTSGSASGSSGSGSSHSECVSASSNLSGSSGSAGSSGSTGTSGSSGGNGSVGTSGTSGSCSGSSNVGSISNSGSNVTHGSSGTAGSSGHAGSSGSAGTSGSSGGGGSPGTSGSSGSASGSSSSSSASSSHGRSTCCPNLASVHSLGTGCAPSGSAVPALAPIGLPIPGDPFGVDLSSPDTPNNFAVILLGFNTTFSPVFNMPLPLDLGTVFGQGFAGCTLYTSGHFVSGVLLDGSGDGTYQSTLPGIIKFCLAEFSFQGFILNSRNQPLASNGVNQIVGN